MNSLFLKVSFSKYPLDVSQWFGGGGGVGSCLVLVFQNITVGCNPEHEFSLIIDYIPICNIHTSKNEESVSVNGISFTFPKESFLLKGHRLHIR